jgi:hypothetical protein
MTLRPIRFAVAISPTGRAVARAVDIRMEVEAESLADLRDRLAERLEPFGCVATLVGLPAEEARPKG